MSKIDIALEEFENRLRSSGYQQLEPFYLLKEGEIYDERDGGIQKIDKQRLQAIADSQNSRTVESGDATPIIIGHTKRHLPEKDQPPIVGLAPRWDVAKFFNTNKWGLRAIPWAKPGSVKLSENETITCINAFDRFPRRSAEFWTNPDVLDPISILGANTPRLDLGLHRLQENRQSIQLGQHYKPRTPIILEMDMPDPLGTTAPATPDSAGDSAIFNSDRFKKIEDCCSRMEGVLGLLEPFLDDLRQAQAPGGDMGGMGPGGMGAGGPMGGPPGGPQLVGQNQPPPPGQGGEIGGNAPGGGGPEDDDDDEPVRAMAAVPAGGTNTMMPRQLDQQSGRRGQPQRTADPRDKVIEQLQLQVAALQLQQIENTVNTTLDGLEDKIIFDRSREFKHMVQLSKQDMDAHVAYMQNTYKPKDEPLPEPPVPLQMHARQPNQQTAGSPMTLQQVRDMMSTPPDPAMVQAGAQKSRYDQLVDIVRNRGRNGKPVMQAYEEVMGKAQGTGDQTPVR